jgi:DNA-binding NarL/FixJ family response regulator
MRVVVADDTVIMREGLAHLLHEARLDVAGLAADAAELYQPVERSRSEVAIVDISMPPTFTDEGPAGSQDDPAALALDRHPGAPPAGATRGLKQRNGQWR